MTLVHPAPAPTHAPRVVLVPEGMTPDEAWRILTDAVAPVCDPDADVHQAIDDALPEGEWTPQSVLANLRAAGFDIVKAGAR